MFEADERARASEGEVEHAQVRTVTAAPYHPLVAGGDQLATPADDAAIRPDEQLAVVQGASGALAEAQAYADTARASGRADRLQRGRRDLHRLGVEALQVGVDRHRIE